MFYTKKQYVRNMGTPFRHHLAASGQARLPVGLVHWSIVASVFTITGILSMLFGRLLLNGILHLDGNLWSGPWSYRIAYLLLIPPFYSVTLVAVGTLLGKHAYFKNRVLRMWSRLLPWRLRNPSGGVDV